MARDVGFGHGQAEVIPAAPSTRDHGKSARAGSVSGSGKRFAQCRGAVIAVEEQDRVRHQAGLWGDLQAQFFGHAGALLGLRQG